MPFIQEPLVCKRTFNLTALIGSPIPPSPIKWIGPFSSVKHLKTTRLYQNRDDHGAGFYRFAYFNHFPFLIWCISITFGQPKAPPLIPQAVCQIIHVHERVDRTSDMTAGHHSQNHSRAYSLQHLFHLFISRPERFNSIYFNNRFLYSPVLYTCLLILYILSQTSNHKVTRVGPSVCHECVSFQNI